MRNHLTSATSLLGVHKGMQTGLWRVVPREAEEDSRSSSQQSGLQWQYNTCVTGSCYTRGHQRTYGEIALLRSRHELSTTQPSDLGNPICDAWNAKGPQTWSESMHCYRYFSGPFTSRVISRGSGRARVTRPDPTRHV